VDKKLGISDLLSKLSIVSIYYISSLSLRSIVVTVDSVTDLILCLYFPFFFSISFYVLLLPPYFWRVSQVVMFTLSTSSVVHDLMVVFMLCPSSHFYLY